MKSKLFKKDYIRISIHKTELADCGSNNPPENSKDLDFGTRYQLDNLVAWGAPIIAENVGNEGQCYCLWHVIIEKTCIDVEVI